MHRLRGFRMVLPISRAAARFRLSSRCNTGLHQEKAEKQAHRRMLTIVSHGGLR